MALNGTIPIEPEPENIYGYIPSKPIAIVFIALFSIASVTHTAQAIARKVWFLFPTTVLCGILEAVGWAGRLWSHFKPFDEIPFQIQIVCTIIGPTPLLAANFIIFGRLIRKLGTKYSRLSPRLYTAIFCTCDVVSLCVQAGGGALAAMSETLEDANRGGQIMLGGIVFQLVVIVVYSILALEYFYRYTTDHRQGAIKEGHIHYTNRGELTTKLRLMLFGLGFNTLVLFIRAIYRTAELADGWNGTIIETEVYFNVLDGAMTVLAIFTFIFLHPGWMLVDRFEVHKKGLTPDSSVLEDGILMQQR